MSSRQRPDGSPPSFAASDAARLPALGCGSGRSPRFGVLGAEDDDVHVIPGAVTQLDCPTRLPTDSVTTERLLRPSYRSRDPTSFRSASDSCDEERDAIDAHTLPAARALPPAPPRDAVGEFAVR
jgi:hypothetical protein